MPDSKTLATEVAAETETDVRTVRKVMLAVMLAEPVKGKVAERVLRELKRRKFFRKEVIWSGSLARPSKGR